MADDTHTCTCADLDALGLAGKSEYVQGLSIEECATLLNIDVKDKGMMDLVFDTAFAIKNRIYGNRIVLFAPLYIANYCVNSCTYCAFRAGNKTMQVGRTLPQHHAYSTRQKQPTPTAPPQEPHTDLFLSRPTLHAYDMFLPYPAVPTAIGMTN